MRSFHEHWSPSVLNDRIFLIKSYVYLPGLFLFLKTKTQIS